MAIQHTKEFGVYHWDTFDNETLLLDQFDTVQQATKFVETRYKDRINGLGADRVEIVDRRGSIVARFSVT